MSKIAKEQAEKEILDWLEANDIPTDTKGMGKDEAVNFESSVSSLARAMMAGALTIADGNLKYKLHKRSDVLSELSFNEFNGGDLASMKTAKGQESEALLRLAARLAKIDYKLIMRIKGRDLTCVIAVVSLLLGSLQSSW